MDLFLWKSVCITVFKKIFYIFYFIFPQSCFTIGVVKTEHRGDGMDNEQLWNKFLNDIEFENNHDLLNLIENVSIEVVSPTNVIFANKSQSTVLLFNESLDLIENAFNKACKNKKSFICLTLNDWNIEKNRYMELLKNKQNNFVYIEEKDDIINEDDVNLSVSIANDLFGDSLLEVK